tara:strand:+ start:241 stop:486 length:246 start_codon:yes stop_codon:yes gene_type:complete
MRDPIFPKYTVPSEGEMGCDYLLWGGGAYVDFDLDTITYSTRAKRLLRVPDLVHLEVWKVRIRDVDDGGSIDDCSCSDNLH